LLEKGGADCAVRKARHSPLPLGGKPLIQESGYLCSGYMCSGYRGFGYMCFGYKGVWVLLFLWDLSLFAKIRLIARHKQSGSLIGGAQ
jgi:hypothetical protein